MTKTTKIIPTILLSAILIGVVFTFNTPLNEAQAVHPDKNGNPITICLATNPHLAMKPQTDMQPDPLFTGITSPPEFMVTWTFNRPIADSLAVHGLGFLTLTGPGLSIQPTSFGPVTNNDQTVKINFDGATVAAALEQHLNNLNVNMAFVSLSLFADYGAQPHLFDDTNNQAPPGIICATSVMGSDAIKVIRTIEVDIDIKPGSDPSSVNCKANKKGDINGVVPVAIFSDDNFDATTIEIELVSMSLVSSSPVLVTEVHGELHPEDVDGDGLLDAILHLDKAGVCEATEDAPLKESVDVTLTGSTTDGLPFEGTGDIRIVKR